MSWTWPSPPPLRTNDSAARVCSVLGKAPPRDKGMSEPLCSLPFGGASVGGASSICSEPRRLVKPIVAVELSGRITSRFRLIVTRACHPWRSIFVSVPTLTSPTRTRELGWMLLTSGNSAWIMNAPSPPPWVPGIGNEFNPRQSPQPDIPASAATAATLLTMRRVCVINRHLLRAPSVRTGLRWGRSTPRQVAVRRSALRRPAAPPARAVRSRDASSPRCR